MPEKANATSGQLVASRTVSTNGNGAHAHDSTVWAAGDHAIWRNADHDLPVVIAGLAGEHAGVRYYSVEGSSTGIPEHELLREQAASVLGAANSNRTQLDDLRALAEAARLEPPANETATPKSDEHTEYLLRAGLSDEGNAQCVTRLYAGQFLHSEALGWLAYTGTHWATDGAEARLDRAIVDTLLARIRATWQHSADDDDDGDDSFERRLRAFCNPNKGRVEGAKHLLRSLVHVEPAEFDAEPDMLNCRNGVLDLRSGKLIAHEPAQRFMHCTSADYRPAADPATWVQWLTQTVGSADMADWLQLAVGYSLTGHTREEILFYLFGPPRSGKGAFTETLVALLGSPLAKDINFATFTAQRTGDTQNFDLAPLKPCRMVAASESNTYERFNEAKVKAITGGNEIYCAHKHRAHFNYRPQFKVWLASNQPVNADPDDDAVWGRIRLIEFPYSHLGAEDKLLKDRLRSKEMLEGLLAWAVQGAMRWYALGGKGLGEPPSSQALKHEQRETLDAVGMWREERCTLGEHHFSAGSQLYQDYEKWCKENGVEPKKQKGFATALQRKGHKADRATVDGKQARGFYGLKLDT